MAFAENVSFTKGAPRSHSLGCEAIKPAPSGTRVFFPMGCTCWELCDQALVIHSMS